MKRRGNILVIDDEEPILDALRLNLAHAGFTISTAKNGEEGLALFDNGDFDLVLCDLQLPDMPGTEVLKKLKEKRASVEVIIISGYGSVSNAVEATKAGAFHFVEKPFEFDALQLLIERALERKTLIEESDTLRRTLQQRTTYSDIVGRSKQMQNIFEMIEAVAKSDANILIVGESGTGKELIANAIHYNSHRAKGPFVKVNCAALPKELIESELFGHTKGAFTGAARDKEGLIARANGGSLLLDEIAEMPLELQPKLLRALQERVFYRLGSERPVEVDFRLICSTNRNPPEAVRSGLLREDLYYRISTITIEVPPLRDRAEDIQLLADHFLKSFAEKYNKRVQAFSQGATSTMYNYHWPGNVRELESALERAILLSKGENIEASDLPFTATEAPQPSSGGSTTEFYVPPEMKLEDIEREVIYQTLKRTKGNKQAAATALGIYRPRLYSKIRKYNLTEFM
ncbi:MAG TPA: sigma-54 dependent transcriptional regulator [Blastocatellia bacterium]|nr:sigma-54 dependent transcriptional regulator [Blastocatellia bacterium]